MGASVRDDLSADIMVSSRRNLVFMLLICTVIYTSEYYQTMDMADACAFSRHSTLLRRVYKEECKKCAQDLSCYIDSDSELPDLDDIFMDCKF